MTMTTTSVLVLGSNFAGLTAALALKHELGDAVDVTVASTSRRFLFTPSLIWVPFGKRNIKKISFPVDETLDQHDVHFIHQAATRIDPDAKMVALADGTTRSYDYLVIATGYRNDLDRVPGIGMGQNASTITTAPEAVEAGVEWMRFLDDPGDIVIGAAPGAGCFGAAYEFLFNTAYQLKKAGLAKDVRLTYVTAEPFLGHFGIGGLPHGEQLLGMFLKKEGIEAHVSVGIDHIDDGAMQLADGTTLPF